MAACLWNLASRRHSSSRTDDPTPAALDRTADAAVDFTFPLLAFVLGEQDANAVSLVGVVIAVGAIRAAEPSIVQEYVRQLSSPKFAERQAAAKALTDVSEAASPALRKTAKGSPDLETCRRAEQLVQAIEGRVYGPALRAIARFGGVITG
jgi:hypothetical protein